jgi:microcystin-dependent protein
MHAGYRGFVDSIRTFMAACIVIFALFGCNPYSGIFDDDDLSLGDAFYGSITLFANSTTAPNFFFACDGRYLSTSHYEGLHAILGDAYGVERYVDTNRQFALPVLDAPVPGTGYYICYMGSYPMRTLDGDIYLSNDYIGAISRFGGSYNPPGTYYCDGSLIDYVSWAGSRLTVVLGKGFQYEGNLFNLPDLTAEVVIEEKKDRAKKSYIAYNGVMPSEYGTYSKSFFCGIIKLMAGHIIPEGWRECNGAELQVAEYSLLHEMMTYGSPKPSTAPSTFHLPNIPAPIEGTRYIINTNGMWPFNQI